MTFPVTNANVVTFITTDPYTVGFDAIRTAHPGSDAELIAACNNKTGTGSSTEPADPISSAALIDLIDAGNFVAMNSAQLAQLNAITQPGTVNVGNESTQSKLNAVFSGMTATLNNLTNAYSQAASPWERYFGAGQSADAGTLDAARNSNGGSQF